MPQERIGLNCIAARDSVACFAARALQQHPRIQLIKPRSHERFVSNRILDHQRDDTGS
jgi:hypothetical protein